LAEIIIPPDIGVYITDPVSAGAATISFYTWMDQVSNAINNLQPLTGAGSPEAAVIASPGRWYVDTDAAAGAGIYFKESGDENTGWVLRS